MMIKQSRHPLVVGDMMHFMSACSSQQQGGGVHSFEYCYIFCLAELECDALPHAFWDPLFGFLFPVKQE